MTTKVRLCSNALLLISHGSIDSLNENETAKDLYEGIYRNLLCMRYWSFAKGKKQLNKLAASPVNEWQNAFQIPSEVLAIYKVYPSRTDYQIYEDKILTDASSIALDFIFRVDEANIPPTFEKLVEYRLAAEFAIPITHKADVAKFFENMFDEQWYRAASMDSMQDPNPSEQHQPFLWVRNSGAGGWHG